jgi:hypothetical protein
VKEGKTVASEMQNVQDYYKNLQGKGYPQTLQE